ncbi:3-isopropylmalate dehydratase small subunit [Candidimonas nitroreducens]|uniref:3-isopropylmalate dehydratase small subunit n=1 Tax=Candidimonas nitroreducens TaxID=683354 RepID=A0A225M754_9BURK|nr:3-isopropylmalate dehydratase small subunit [Candidimonas nitroreducens]OWT54799.1 3-isopropylmalate dehydratase small subunit [Candidimonas nitroreducens]
MEQFVRIEGLAAPLVRDNIDTDSLIPSREMTSPGKEGYGEKLLASWRYLPGGQGTRVENPDFVLNKPPFRQARFLLAGANFGCGSSREQAVWALRQFGIRAVLAPGFGAIFQNNCYRNGLLPVTLPRELIQDLAGQAEAGNLTLAVDLELQRVQVPDGRNWPFKVPANERAMMLAGLDAISLTLRRKAEIAAFQEMDRQRRPWIWLQTDTQETTR